ncbi:DICT sensory domain-containing protein [Micromonospora sp. NPDC047548]|uniref:DICT sensory domain-containing protein n=1 Tax=Micromonospora sp. NPDC047548 TaxID=3155624 RepID=UPI0033E936F1
MTKRNLVTVSHAIEQAALATAEDGPLVVIALFQRLPYFARERARYERIATGAAVTVVGLVGEPPSGLPAGAYGVALDEAGELAREWTVVALTRASARPWWPGTAARSRWPRRWPSPAGCMPRWPGWPGRTRSSPTRCTPRSP